MPLECNYFLHTRYGMLDLILCRINDWINLRTNPVCSFPVLQTSFEAVCVTIYNLETFKLQQLKLECHGMHKSYKIFPILFVKYWLHIVLWLHTYNMQ